MLAAPTILNTWCYWKLSIYACPAAISKVGGRSQRLWHLLRVQEVRKGVRKLIIDCILATDMSQHFSITNEFTKHSPEYNLDDASDRTLLSKVGIRQPPAARCACLSLIHDATRATCEAWGSGVHSVAH